MQIMPGKVFSCSVACMWELIWCDGTLCRQGAMQLLPPQPTPQMRRKRKTCHRSRQAKGSESSGLLCAGLNIGQIQEAVGKGCI